MTRMSLIAVVAALALALPAAAIAQSAGDNQYQDPLAAPHHGSSSGSTRSNGGSGGASTSTQSQGTSAAGTSSQSPSGAAAGGGGSRGLPRTGGHPALAALFGVVLLLGGVTLRRTAGIRRT